MQTKNAQSNPFDLDLDIPQASRGCQGTCSCICG